MTLVVFDAFLLRVTFFTHSKNDKHMHKILRLKFKKACPRFSVS